MRWLFQNRSPKTTKPGRRLRLGFEPLECRTMLASNLAATATVATTTKPVATTATVRTTDATATTPTLAKGIDAMVNQFAKFSPNQLKQLDKGLQAVEMIAHLSDMFDMMADHLKAGTNLGFSFDTFQTSTSRVKQVSDLFAQLQKSMSGPNFTDLLKQFAGPESPLPTLPKDQMGRAQANIAKAFETINTALAALGIREVQVVMSGDTGGSGGGAVSSVPGSGGGGAVSGTPSSAAQLGDGAWGAFVKVPGTSGDGWTFLLSIPGLQQQDMQSLLNQWKPGVDPTTSETVGWDAGTAAMNWFATVGTISAGFGAVGGAIGLWFDAPDKGAGIGAAVGALIGIPIATAKELRDYLDANRTEPITETQPATGSQPASDPKKTNPIPDGMGPEEYDPHWGWYNPIAVNPATGVADPPDEFEEAAFDMAKFVRLVVAAAISKVNPNPEGSTGGSGSGSSGGTTTGGTFGGILGGDPSDDQPVVYTDTSPGGNPIIMYFPPKVPIGK